ncbi:MAG: NUDIX hydrolase [Aeromicrobium sp.]|uniref:NUDIX domain-containing protein n=1 Tax=Aeromicrobium sp. TaxID=1871063 RepID=UPI0039E637B1
MDAHELADDFVRLRPERSNAGFDGYSVWMDGERIGSVALHQESSSTWSVRWNVGDGPGALRPAIHVVRLVVDHVLGTLGGRRVEARIPVGRDTDIRAASICGLRKEGVTRGPGREPDRVLMARLLADPPVQSRDGFIAILNAGLPTKRVISQGLWRDPDGRVLLCELTYKSEWDLPGGVIEVGESPAVGLRRELAEELGIEVEVGGLVTVNWLPAWRGWDDACVFVFDLGGTPVPEREALTLQAAEIADVHWCDPATVRERATAATIELLEALESGVPAYRESSQAD